MKSRILLLAVLALAGCAVGIGAWPQDKPSAPSGSPPSAPPAPPAARAPLILLYDSLPDTQEFKQLQPLNAQKWLQINQDAKSYTTGVIDVEVLMKEIGTRTNLKPPEWVMLDFEEPFFNNLNKDPNSADFKGAVQTMVTAIRAARARYPNSKWTFYGIPNLSYWVNGQGWATAPVEARREALRKASLGAQPLIDECDWVSVSIYDYYDPAMIVPGSPNSIRGTPDSVRADGRAWRTAAVELAKGLGKGKPVIPTVFPFWAPGGVAPHCRLLTPKRFIEEQVVPAVQAGASGIALWTGMSYRINQVIDGGKDQGYVTKEANFGIKDWRDAFTADYFGGVAPRNWGDEQVRRMLLTKTTRTIIDSLSNIRAWERNGALP